MGDDFGRRDLVNPVVIAVRDDAHLQTDRRGDMGSYVSKILSDGESVQLKAKLHWIGYLPAVMWLVTAMELMVVVEDPGVKVMIGVLAAPIAVILFGLHWIATWTTELAVTDRRIVAKTDLIARETSEINRAKVEGVDVRQSVFGRLLNYGTVSVRGTGGAIAPITRIRNPIAFRKAVHTA